MERYVFLDTNNWIYLSNGFNINSQKHDELHLKVFSFINERVESGDLVLLVNSLVLEEWNNNKAHTENHLKDITNKYKSYNDSLLSIENFIQGNIPEIEKLKLILKKEFEEKTEKYKTHIKNVEELLLKKTKKIRITNQIKIEAVNLASGKKAPFVGEKKNSMNDALIFLSALDYIYSKGDPFPFDSGEPNIFPESFFVSSNIGDFSDPKSKENIHPDLKPYLDRTHSKFCFSLAQLLKHLESRPYLTPEEEEFIELDEKQLLCPQCEFEYYPTLELSDYISVFNPDKHIPANQLKLEFSNFEFEIGDLQDSSTEIRVGHCSNCYESFIECTCGNLLHIHKFSEINECNECGTKFKTYILQDNKGIQYHEYEILNEYTCVACGKSVEKVNIYDKCDGCT